MTFDNPYVGKTVKLTEKKVLEKDIEAPAVAYAKRTGGMADKFTSPSKRSVPDRLMTSNEGFVYFIEFKAPGKRATAKQLLDHQKRRELGCVVYVIDDIDEAKAVIDYHNNGFLFHMPGLQGFCYGR